MTDVRHVSVGALFFQSCTFVCHYSPVNFCPPLAVAHIRQLAAAAPGHGMQPGGGPWERQAARLLVLRAFRATAPAELQELLRDDGVAASDDPAMQELAPLVAAVQTLPPVTRQQLLQLWQDTLQLVQGGSGPRQPAVQACDAGAMTDVSTPSA